MAASAVNVMGWYRSTGQLRRWAAFTAVSLAAAALGCGANDQILRSGKETPQPANIAPSVSSLEKDVEEMRTADFAFIFVIRRKDGGAFDAADKGVIRAQTDQVNRRVSSEGGKVVVLGSNYQISPEKMAVLYDRFAVENYSRPDAVNTADNANIK